MSASSSLSIRWQKAEAIGKILSYLLVPFLIWYLGNAVNSALKQKELSVAYVEIATAVLRDQPTPRNQALRDWAISVLTKHADPPLTESAIKALRLGPIYSQPVAECIADQLRAWLGRNQNNMRRLESWLASNAPGVGSTMFLIKDEYASLREQFLKEVGEWK